MNVSLLFLLGLLLMPAPTNISFATATNLGTLTTSETTVTQQVDDAGTTYTVYYKFTAPATATVIGVFGYGDASVYTPTTTPYDHTETLVLSIPGGANEPIQFPVTGGALYYLKVVSNGGNPTPANLTLNAKAATQAVAPIGSIAVNDDTTGFPLALLSSTTDYMVQRFVLDFPAGEAGDTLINGTVLVENINDNTVDRYTVTAGEFVLQAQTSITIPKIRTCLGGNKFYVGNNANPATFFTITATGTVSSPVTLTSNTSLGALAASNDETLLYFAQSGAGEAVKTWNIPGGAAGSDLAVGIANYSIRDILVLSDDTILVGYQRGTVDYKVLHYSAAGTTLNTYTFGGGTSTQPRLAYAIDEPNSFWVWLHPSGGNTGTSKYLNIKVSDGSTLTTRLQAEFETGTAQPTASATPLGRFGPSFSCPFWILRQTIGTSSVTSYPIRRMRQFLLPSDPDNRTLFLDYLELLMRTGVGNSDAPDPQVMLQISRDGGKTWGNELWRSAGAVGEWKDRVRWLRLGRYRNAVVRIVVSDPVDWQFVSMMGNLTRGTS